MTDAIHSEQLHNACILVVDDVEMTREVLRHSLNTHGYTNIVTAENGSQALQITHEIKPDLVILDLIMPGMDGFAYCEAVRRDHHFDNMPIIVQTAVEDIDKKLKAFQLGASDYICKPLDHGELNARARVHLTQKMLIEDLNDYRTRTSKELGAARAMLDRLMPDSQKLQMYERVFDIKIASYFETSWAMGGDCWGTRPLSEHKLAIYMYDFSGHGISAAMNIFRMHTIMQEFMHSGSEPGSFLTSLNRHLVPLLECEEFATMFYGIIDTEANCLLYASAAAPAGIIFSATEPEPVMLQSRGFPLGVVSHASFDTKYVPFNPGDMLLFYSDCLFESSNSAGEYLSDAQIKKAVASAIRANTTNPAQHSLDALLDLFSGYGDSPLGDDLTVNAYWRNPKSVP